MNQPRPRGRAGFRTSAFSALAIAAVFVACSEVGTGPEAPPLESAFLATSAQLGTPRLRVFEVCSTFPQGAAQDITVQVDVIQNVQTQNPTVVPTFFVTIPAETCLDVWNSGFPADEVTVEQISPDICEIGFENSLITGNVLINRPFRPNDSDFTGRIGNDVGRSVTFVNDCFGEIGDFVWNDLNQDGLQDPGEPGIQGVTVNLKDAGGNVVATTTTGSNGEYLFVDLTVDATYTVEVDASTLPGSFVASPSNVGGDPTIDSNGSPTSTTLDVSNLSDLTLDFGYYQLTGEIGDFVWNDLNQDGVQDPGEPGIPGVTVNLKDAGGNVVGTTVTGPNGDYLFSGVTPGDYVVEIDPTTLPPNFVPTPSNQGGDPALDSNGSPTSTTLDPNNLSDLTLDFGYYELAGTIGDFVWNDLDRDGIQDPGEPGIGGIEVILKDAGGGVIGTTTTAPDGSYSFGPLTLGDYTVEVNPASLPANFVPTPSNQGGDPALDSNGSPTSTTLDPNNTSDLTLDFGYFELTGEIGDFVWNDLNQDGIQDSGEPGIQGIMVNLRNSAGALIATTNTGPNGDYLFSGLSLDETYTVEVASATVPANFVPSPSDVGPDRTVDSNGSPASTTLSAATPSDRTIDFGYYEQAGAIGDFVWNDQNQDGIQDPGEPGIPGVDVILKDAGGNVITTATTGPNGMYMFGPLPLGTYTVEIDPATLPGNFTPSPSNVGPDRTVDSNGSPTSTTLDLANPSDLSLDFGFYEETGEIGDFVWNDGDRDGIQDPGEAGIPDVTVTLKDAGGTVVATTTTGPNGDYLFTDLPFGDYTVEVDASTLPANFRASPSNAGSNRAVDSNGSPAAVTIDASNQSDLTIDFGYFEVKGVIGDFVWNDVNMNGLQLEGEPGIGGVTINLKDAAGNIVQTTVTRASDGKYIFRGVTLDQTYTVEVDESTLPPNFVPTPSLQGGDTRWDSNGSPATVTLTLAKRVDTTIDFGYFQQQLGEIGDFVWNDLDRDGIQDPGEPGIPGIGVSLKDAGGAVVATTTTGGAGGYLFSGLTLGDYTVEIDATTLPFGYLPTTSMASGSTPANDSNGSPASTTLDVANPVDLTLDFGFFDPGPCDVCKGGVTGITLRYLGNPGDNVFFDIASDETATQVGPQTWRIDGNAGDKIGDFDILVNGAFNANIHTSCSQPVEPGLVYGAFIIEDAYSKDNGRVCPLGDCSFTQDPPTVGSDRFEWKIYNTGTTSLAISSIEVGWPGAAGALEKVSFNGTIFQGSVAAPPAGGTVTLDESDWSGALKDRLAEPGNNETLTLEFAQAADLSDITLRVSFYGPDNGTCVLDLDDLPDPPEGVLCQDGKPQALTIQFTGDDCSVMNNTQDPSKAICTGDRGGADPVWVIAGDKDNASDPAAGRWFSGQVSVGGTFDIDAANDGQTKLASATHVHVFDAAMQTLLQSIEFHTSCSQPLFIGDQFGPILLTDWTPEP